MAIQEDVDDDDTDINPVTMIFPEDQQQDEGIVLISPTVEEREANQHHYLRSVESTVEIRQLRSQGLSFQLWPAATALVTLLDHHRSHPTTSPLALTLSAFPTGRRLRILELGSGTGLVGIAAAATLGAYVTVTDLPHVIPNLQFNAEANSEAVARHSGVVHVAPLRWGEIDDFEAIGRDYDLVLGSDVVYHDRLYDPLIQTLRFLLLGGEKKMVFLMAHLRRWKKESAFFKRARKLFDVEVIHADRPSDGSRVGVLVYRFAPKGQILNSLGS
ncbi:putative methyltransferase family protein [Actinidia rufa]|uniref:Putative methyltransferase family protein n=1 Tax=Actinidia rufa TaxID=165716 RepID=A0A7J0E2N2_9ERIC|nr:putative methyltransferase family protein [Actinidia rufa]